VSERRYELIEHTADVGIAVRGRDEAELIANAACGLLDLIADRETVVACDERSCTAQGLDAEERLQSALSELLFLHDTERILFREVDVEVSGEVVTLRARGEPFDPARHTILHQIKAVTFYGLEVERAGDELRARIIFDV